jgi:hypothetical protein
MTTADPQYFFDVPDWQTGSGRRLNIAMLAASILIVTALSLIRIPVAGNSIALTELVVELIMDAAESATEPEQPAASDVFIESVADSDLQPEGHPDTQPDTNTIQPIQIITVRRSVTSTDDVTPVADSPDIDDWHEFGTGIVRERIANPEKQYTVNPPFDEKRRVAAIKFRPSEAPIKREIWENVEKDQLGRTILRDGNCFRVLDDPSGVNREIFETFDQHMIYCSLSLAKAPPKELPWVNEIREQYAYLRLREEQRRDSDAFQ